MNNKSIPSHDKLSMSPPLKILNSDKTFKSKKYFFTVLTTALATYVVAIPCACEFQPFNE